MDQKSSSQQTLPLIGNALAVCRVGLVVLFVITSTLTVASHTSLQDAPSTADPDCKCETIFKSLVSKVESNYVGFSLDSFAKRAARYQSFEEALRKRAHTTSSENCVFVLQDFVRFFEDGHMFINETPKLTDEDAARLTATAEQTGRKEDDIRHYLDDNAGHLDHIEGVWYARDGYRIGIMRDYKPNRRDFVAVMLSNDVERWKPGQVKAEFRKLSDASYSVVFYSSRHYPLHPAVYLRGQQGGAAIRRGLLLHMPPITWGKAYPLKQDEQNALDPTDPRRPTIRSVGSSTIVVSVPSHSPEYASVLNELVEKYRERILSADNLIIDIRGDEGGSSWMTNVLNQFMVTKAKRPGRPAEKPVVVSSPDNIAYFDQMKSQGWVPPHLVDRMKANPGRVIPFSDPESGDDPQPKSAEDSATPLPRNVAILIDGAVVSAGEAFVLAARENEKVTVFGEHTGGCIDYQNVTITRLLVCPPLGLNFGYPTLAASDKLPLGGFNSTGVAPTVNIGVKVKDKIGFVIDYYQRHKKSE
jgi:hypothetical protein